MVDQIEAGLEAEVERVARLLCRAHGSDPDSENLSDEDSPGDWRGIPAWRAYRRRAAGMVVQARLVAELLSEPALAPMLLSLKVLAD